MTTRIYRVADGDDVRLVNAASPAQAIRHCAANRYKTQYGSAADNDRWSLYEFTRNSRLPRDTFKREFPVDGMVFIVCAILGVVWLIAANL